jgi:hypothetical protein
MAAAVNGVVKVLRPGDEARKSDPFTIVLVANPALEAPWKSGAFIVDPVMSNEPSFDGAVQYIQDALFGNLPGQREVFLGDPAIAPHVRVVSLFESGLPAEDANALVAQDGVSNLLVARRSRFVPFLNRSGLKADVVYAVSASRSHHRSSAWFTSDDDTRPGTPFTLDSVALYHHHYNLIPGTVAIHTTSSSLAALHEFGHALSSYTNGSVVDLYVDSNVALNNKRGRPIPPTFATYNGPRWQPTPLATGWGIPAAGSLTTAN